MMRFFSPWKRRGILTVCTAVTCLVTALFMSRAVGAEAGQIAAVQFPPGAQPADAIALLQKRLDRGEVALRFRPEQGFLISTLETLNIPLSSQVLVFSRTSVQLTQISPATPRALYFNDDVYVGWIQNSPALEIVSTDPRYGIVFYTLDQNEQKPPAFQRFGLPCASCHAPTHEDIPAPLLLMMSARTDDTGNAIGNFRVTTDRSPLSERWGGWYVSGTHGEAPHMGRAITFNTSPYPTPHSDIVALSVLAHQLDVHNRISEASQQIRLRGTQELESAVEPLVRALLFSGAAPLPAPIRGTSGFAEEFAARGPRDPRGRSLRDFDLERRLFRYPLSYMIYSESFRQLPDAARQYVYRRLRDVLNGKDESGDFRHLSTEDRTAISEILSATVPEFIK